jgi:hypothetical protein
LSVFVAVVVFRTALHVCSMRGDADVAEALLASKKVPIDAVDDSQQVSFTHLP